MPRQRFVQCFDAIGRDPRRTIARTTARRSPPRSPSVARGARACRCVCSTRGDGDEPAIAPGCASPCAAAPTSSTSRRSSRTASALAISPPAARAALGAASRCGRRRRRQRRAQQRALPGTRTDGDRRRGDDDHQLLRRGLLELRRPHRSGGARHQRRRRRARRRPVRPVGQAARGDRAAEASAAIPGGSRCAGGRAVDGAPHVAAAAALVIASEGSRRRPAAARRRAPPARDRPRPGRGLQLRRRARRRRGRAAVCRRQGAWLGCAPAMSRHAYHAALLVVLLVLPGVRRSRRGQEGRAGDLGGARRGGRRRALRSRHARAHGPRVVPSPPGRGGATGGPLLLGRPRCRRAADRARAAQRGTLLRPLHHARGGSTWRGRPIARPSSPRSPPAGRLPTAGGRRCRRPQAFTLIREGDRWRLADDLFLDTAREARGREAEAMMRARHAAAAPVLVLALVAPACGGHSLEVSRDDVVERRDVERYPPGDPARALVELTRVLQSNDPAAIAERVTPAWRLTPGQGGRGGTAAGYGVPALRRPGDPADPARRTARRRSMPNGDPGAHASAFARRAGRGSSTGSS